MAPDRAATEKDAAAKSIERGRRHDRRASASRAVCEITESRARAWRACPSAPSMTPATKRISVRARRPISWHYTKRVGRHDRNFTDEPGKPRDRRNLSHASSPRRKRNSHPFSKKCGPRSTSGATSRSARGWRSAANSSTPFDPSRNPSRSISRGRWESRSCRRGVKWIPRSIAPKRCSAWRRLRCRTINCRPKKAFADSSAMSRWASCWIFPPGIIRC